MLEDVSKKDIKKNQSDVKDRVAEAISMNQLELDLSGPPSTLRLLIRISVLS